MNGVFVQILGHLPKYEHLMEPSKVLEAWKDFTWFYVNLHFRMEINTQQIVTHTHLCGGTSVISGWAFGVWPRWPPTHRKVYGLWHRWQTCESNVGVWLQKSCKRWCCGFILIRSLILQIHLKSHGRYLVLVRILFQLLLFGLTWFLLVLERPLSTLSLLWVAFLRVPGVWTARSMCHPDFSPPK